MLYADDDGFWFDGSDRGQPVRVVLGDVVRVVLGEVKEGPRVPLYEYQCHRCGHKFEKLVPRCDASQPQRCPRCGAEDSRRLMSAFAVRSAQHRSACSTTSG